MEDVRGLHISEKQVPILVLVSVSLFYVGFSELTIPVLTGTFSTTTPRTSIKLT